jgi:hypothetical protein
MLSIAQDPMMAVNPDKRAEFLRGAGKAAHTKVPEILREIDDTAHMVIHGEPP